MRIVLHDGEPGARRLTPVLQTAIFEAAPPSLMVVGLMAFKTSLDLRTNSAWRRGEKEEIDVSRDELSTDGKYSVRPMLVGMEYRTATGQPARLPALCIATSLSLCERY